MAYQQRSRFERLVRLDERHSISIEAGGGEIEPGQLELGILTPKISSVLTPDRAEAREVAYFMIEATQRMLEQGS
jgi:hypothetical protein